MPTSSLFIKTRVTGRSATTIEASRSFAFRENALPVQSSQDCSALLTRCYQSQCGFRAGRSTLDMIFSVRQMCNSFATACTEFRLTISLSKTESVRHSCPPHVTINGTVLSVVEKFVYLGSTLKANNSLDAELNTRIGRASTTFGRLQSRVWNNSHLSLKAKVHVYESRVLSILLYGSETWPTYRREEHKLNDFHFRCLRQILGLSWQDRVPNTTVLKLTNSSDMYTVIRRRRLGHVRRMPDERLPKLAVGHHPRGRPKLRFKDVVKRDMNVFNINPD